MASSNLREQPSTLLPPPLLPDLQEKCHSFLHQAVVDNILDEKLLFDLLSANFDPTTSVGTQNKAKELTQRYGDTQRVIRLGVRYYNSLKYRQLFFPVGNLSPGGKRFLVRVYWSGAGLTRKRELHTWMNAQ